MMKDIKGFNGYKVNENGIVINKKGHVIRPALSNVGRPRVSLEIYDDNGKLVRRVNKSINRLVAETFIPNPDNLPIVMHKDNDVLHNHVSNLKFGTQSDNIKQAFNEGRKVSRRGPRIQDRYVYEVYNEDKTDIILCKGIERVAGLLGFAEKSIRPGIIKSGDYKDYTIENTHSKAQVPIYFFK